MTESGKSVQLAAWLLLIHQLPAKPAYARVKIWRRLQALGAIALKNSVYALPAGTEAQEDFAWILKEIRAVGGEGMIVESRLIEGLTDAEVRAQFNAAREADYAALEKDIRATIKAAGSDAMPSGLLTRLKAEAARLDAIDFFGAPGRQSVAGLLAGLSAQATGGALPTRPAGLPPKGTVWVTRQDLHVDRIASAWLIRRFLDETASFRFIPAKGRPPRPGEVRFDMFDAEFTHEDDRCTFEVLLARSGLTDKALAAIAEIVHDIDLKDGKFGRDEASGVARIIDGLAASGMPDSQRVQRGGALFDDLYESFRRKRAK